MKVNLEIDKLIKEIEITIKTNEVNDFVNNLLEKLTDEKPKILVGICNDKVKILDEKEIINVYSADKKVFAVTQTSEYILKLPLYEVLDRLNKNKFVRISNTEIVNLDKVNEFDLSFTGTICIKLSNKATSYVSRRYVKEIKNTLGIGGK